MAKKHSRERVGEQDIAAIIAAVERHPAGASRENITKALSRKLAPRTLQFWLKNLVESGRLTSEGVNRAIRYHIPAPKPAVPDATPVERAQTVPVSSAAVCLAKVYRVQLGLHCRLSH